MIKVGIIGLGYWGNILYRSLLKNKKFDIVKVCGRENNNYGDIFTTDYKEVLKSNVELVVISTQTKYHFEHIIEALKHDKHVFVEKPICLSIEEAEIAIDLAKKNGRLLFVDHIYTTNPNVLKINEILKKDKTELVYYKTHRFNEECKLFDTTIIENLMYHDFYILNMLLGSLDFVKNNPNINHTPFEFCDIKFGNINLVSSYKDVKTRIIEIRTGQNLIHWDEVNNVLKNNGVDITPNVEFDNITYKFNDVYNHILKGYDDNSKNISLDILKIIQKL